MTAPASKPFCVRELPFGPIAPHDLAKGSRQIDVVWVRCPTTGRVGIRIVLLLLEGARFLWYLENTHDDIEALGRDLARNVTDPELPFAWQDVGQVLYALKRSGLPPLSLLPPPAKGGS